MVIKMKEIFTVDSRIIKHAHWIDRGTIPGAYDNFDTAECSLCHEESINAPWNTTYEYCPYCGAKMDE